MPVITLPDGSQRSFERSVSIHDIAADIGPGLAKSALAGIVDGKSVDISHTVEADADVEILTEKSPLGLEVIRHSAAHLLAQAVKSLFPEAQVTIGPVIDNGFYYDFAYKRPFTDEDLVAIENKMTELAKADFQFPAEIWRGMMPLLIFVVLKSNTKQRLLQLSLPTKPCRSTGREILRIYAVVPTCLLPARLNTLN